MKEENLKNAFDNGACVHENVHFIVESVPPCVVKQLKKDNVDDYLHFYEKLISLGIATPQILSIDKQNNLIKCCAIGIEGCNGKYHSQTLVNFSRRKEKDEEVIEFLAKTIRYALAHNWRDLHSGNILHHEGSLYLVDYVPGRGGHQPGALGLPRIRERADYEKDEAAANEIERLRANGFDELLERAIDRINDMSVCRDGIEAIRNN